MDLCPEEILFAIFSIACTDDGTTGRALSITSRRARRISAPFKYRSLALNGVAQVKAFAKHLRTIKAVEQDLDRTACSVEHLLVMKTPRPLKSVPEPSAAAMNADLNHTTDEESCYRPSTEDPVLGAATGAPLIPYRATLYHNDEVAAGFELSSLLALVAPTLRTLFTDFDVSICSAADGPIPYISFPRLAACSILTASSVCYRPPFGSPECLPMLTHLHITNCPIIAAEGSSRFVTGFWGDLAMSPLNAALSHLRISGVQAGAEEIYRGIYRLDAPDEADLAHAAPASFRKMRVSQLHALQHALQHVWVEPSPDAHDRIEDEIRLLAEQVPGTQGGGEKFALLRPKPSGYDEDQMKTDWLSFVAGGDGPWPAHKTTDAWR
ncbi:hypothetical protein PUNSTDRAFT_136701 [Punctularia strigosozonata HHB-11173 SS5]|uniref:uncharacterized protein n=1 Tax=Punctularia strigosozonata (strain HHB-11173) TaxID=741275 RepID=UPI000441781A|nr:uncharacterized protein PUNSTDRAFT_136701 [Punctularia strigosozonata HHB-11173 SS5]EIN06880.1 hypothetical protein PUNSTDRAFT_136701 [Punctularia strigosozonata HHB-11173 SS5]